MTTIFEGEKKGLRHIAVHIQVSGAIERYNPRRDVNYSLEAVY